MKADMEKPAAEDFYRIQAEQAKKSRGLIAVLLFFYALSIGLAFVVVDFAVGAVFSLPRAFSLIHIAWLLVLALAFAALAAWFQYADARRNGAAFILKRLSARPPRPEDRYHRQLADVIDEMRIAAGLKVLRAYVIPDPAVNSMALIEADGTPAVAVTEGLLADFTRAELAAAAAHEAAHIARGDTRLLTLVCSTADFFERLGESFVSEKDGGGRQASSPSPVFSRLLVRFIGREQETLADAAAVEIGRDPIGLARAIYKAHLANSFVGDFGQAYAPLFIVSPSSTGEDEAPPDGWTSTHPPIMERIRRLAAMAGLEAGDIIHQVWESRRVRDVAKEIEPFRSGPKSRPVARPKASPDKPNECPRCRVPLAEEIYEGVPVRACRTCGGKLVEMDAMPRILARREVGFSPDLRKKTEAFRERLWLNPVKTLKISQDLRPAATCPSCGYPLKPRPYNYQYFVPVEKCLSCNRIWFDTDELEILQILIEDAAKK